MKKAIEEFTGTIGIGCLVSLGLFFLTDSQFKYWNTIEELMGTNSWGVLISVPILVARLNNELITLRYNEVYQNKRILNGSSIGFILISIGVFLEGIDFWGELRIIGIIGMSGSLIITGICPLIGLRIQMKFNQSIKDYED